mmetsp:Transcript_111030/g.203444  ORF Transcript_111030/g.203444 Transcript_111030/m.203444 type:complete len:86 (+) Transcript_111030:617-874(+)
MSNGEVSPKSDGGVDLMNIILMNIITHLQVPSNARYEHTSYQCVKLEVNRIHDKGKSAPDKKSHQVPWPNSQVEHVGQSSEPEKS